MYKIESSKKSKVNGENRQFQNIWTDKYFLCNHLTLLLRSGLFDPKENVNLHNIFVFDNFTMKFFDFVC